MISPKRSLEQQSNFSQKSSSQFSSLNKFDYPIPIKNFPNTKSPPKPDSMANENKQKQNEQTIRKARYYWHMRNQHHNERDKVKSRQQKITQKQQEEKKQKIIDELMKKKSELQRLQNERQQAIKKHGQAIQNAKKLNKNLQLKRLKSQQHTREEHQKQLERYKHALAKTKSQKQLTELYTKRQHSTKRNETRNLYKSRQRQAAEQYKVEKQAYDKEMEEINRQKEIKQSQDKFVSSMEKKTGKTISFENTCYHNFAKNVVVLDDSKNYATQASSNNASPREFERLYTQRKSLKEQLAEQNIQKSAQRGRQALRKLKEAKQYNNYLQQMQSDQKNYNLLRIQAGKRNQFIGLKSQTLKTQVKHKQYRAEEEFEKVFLTPQSNKNRMNFQESPKGFLYSDRKMLSDQRTQPTQRSNSIRQHFVQQKLSPRNQAHTRKPKLTNEPEQEDTKCIYTLPYNAKIHSIMLEKSRPSYCRNLFEGSQVVKSEKQIKQIINEQNDHVVLDYSMTQDENEQY